MNSTPLLSLLNRMNRYTKIYTIADQFKVRDIDEAIRTVRRTTQLPWTIKKSVIRIFDGVTEYPLASDHDELAYLDTPKSEVFANSANFYYTSLQQFYENRIDRNTLAEIWNGGTRTLGIRYQSLNTTGGFLLNTNKNLSNYTASGDASNLAIDYVNFLENNESISFDVTQSTNVATIEASFDATQQTSYKRGYVFFNLFLGGTTAPTSIDLRFGNDSSNHLHKVATTQFSGQPLQVNSWNLLAFDLNDATLVGTINENAFSYYAVSMNSAPTGVYFLDNTYFRQWSLMDYWYYSKYSIISTGSSVIDKEYFIDDTTNSFDQNDALVGDSEFADVVGFDAILTGVVDEEDEKIYEPLKIKRDEAWNKLLENHPSMKPLISTNKYLFDTDFGYNNQGDF